MSELGFQLHAGTSPLTGAKALQSSQKETRSHPGSVPISFGDLEGRTLHGVASFLSLYEALDFQTYTSTILCTHTKYFVHIPPQCFSYSPPLPTELRLYMPSPHLRAFHICVPAVLVTVGCFSLEQGQLPEAHH